MDIHGYLFIILDIPGYSLSVPWLSMQVGYIPASPFEPRKCEIVELGMSKSLPLRKKFNINAAVPFISGQKCQ